MSDTTPALETVADVEKQLRDTMTEAGFHPDSPGATGHVIDDTSDLTQVLNAAAVPEPAPAPKPYVAPRYVTVWPHVLDEFERFDDCVASVQPNGVLLIIKFDSLGHTPPVKGYAPGSWKTFEHVGDFTPPQPPVPAAVRQRDRAAAVADGDEQADLEGVRRTQRDADNAKARFYNERAAAHRGAPAPVEDGERRSVAPGMAQRPRTYSGTPVLPDQRAEALRKIGAAGGGDEAPKASSAVPPLPIERLAEPGFWEDDADGPKRPSFWRRMVLAAKYGPRLDPSTETDPQ